MKDIISISKKLWHLIVQLSALLVQLSRQVILPNRKRKGNLLHVLFLFYLGLIEQLRHFEHRQFKMAELFQNRLVRKGMMLCTFLLFFLTSYEQPAVAVTSVNEATQFEYSCQSLSSQLAPAQYTRSSPVQTGILSKGELVFFFPAFPQARHYGLKIYLQNRRLLI